VGLLRPGFALIDGLERLMLWDDRGSAFATWRVEPSWGEDEDEWLGFRLTYAIQASVEGIGNRRNVPFDNAIKANLQRRADSYLPPLLVTLDLDFDPKAVNDARLLGILGRPFVDGGGDYNLGSRAQALFDVVDPSLFQERCRAARTRSEEVLRTSKAFKDLVLKGQSRVNQELLARDDQLRRRQRALENRNGHDRTLDRELELNRAIAETVSQPSVRLESIGMFVIAAKPPRSARS